MADPDGLCARQHMEAGTAGRGSKWVRALPARVMFVHIAAYNSRETRTGGIAMQNTAAAPEAKAHTITLNDRKRLAITGVEDVDCFNEQIVVLKTPLGTLTVTGAGLNMSQLSVEDGRVSLEGEVDALEYSGLKHKGGVLGRLFK